jgi:hypothetical protein
MKSERPDLVAKRQSLIPIGELEDIKKVGPSEELKVMVACIDRPLAAAVGFANLKFNDFYRDIDGKIYSEATSLNMLGVQADYIRWTSPEDFFKLSDTLNEICKSVELGVLRTAVYKGAIKIQPDKKEKKPRSLLPISIW